MEANYGPPASLRALQLIILAMMAGVLAVGVVAVALGSRITIQPELAPLLLAILALFGAAELPVYFVVRARVLAGLRDSVEASRDTDTDTDAASRVFPAMATLTIIGGAMAEGFGLFGGVICLLTGNRAALAAPAIALVLLVLRVPTQDKLSAFAAATVEQSQG